MLVFNDRGLWLSCLVRASANLSCLLDFFLDHCLPRIHSYTVILTRFSMRLCSSLKANSARGLHSILPFQKAIINQMIFFFHLHFPENICMSTESVVVHTHRSLTFWGQFIMERNHEVNADCLWPSYAGDLQQKSWSLGELSSSILRSTWHLPLSVCYRV